MTTPNVDSAKGLRDIFLLARTQRGLFGETQLRSVLANMPTNMANALRDTYMTEGQKKGRKELLEQFDMMKTAALVYAAISVIAFAVLPGIFSGLFAACALLCAYEVCTVESNIKKILEDFTIEARCGKSEQALLEQLSQGTFMARHVIPLVW